jgi:hypothetical protein
MKSHLGWVILSPLLAATTFAINFVSSGGQIFTPGFAILDAPQPGTPLGGGAYLT